MWPVPLHQHRLPHTTWGRRVHSHPSLSHCPLSRNNVTNLGPLLAWLAPGHSSKMALQDAWVCVLALQWGLGWEAGLLGLGRGAGLGRVGVRSPGFHPWLPGLIGRKKAGRWGAKTGSTPCISKAPFWSSPSLMNVACDERERGRGDHRARPVGLVGPVLPAWDPGEISPYTTPSPPVLPHFLPQQPPLCTHNFS